MVKLTEITRGYRTRADRTRAIAQLKRAGYDHFVEYRDTHAPIALCFGRSSTPQQPAVELVELSQHPAFAPYIVENAEAFVYTRPRS